MTIYLLAPSPGLNFVGLPSGATYTSDQFSIVVITNGSTADQVALVNAGCVTLAPQPLDLLGYKIGANFNSGGAGAVGDQLIANLVVTQKFRVTRIVVLNTSVNGMGTAVGGFYTGAAKTGTVLVAVGQVYTGLTNAATAQNLTMNAPNAILAALTPVYMSLTTPQGAAATADVYIYGDKIPT